MIIFYLMMMIVNLAAAGLLAYQNNWPAFSFSLFGLVVSVLSLTGAVMDEYD